jgi:hypothetical protein
MTWHRFGRFTGANLFAAIIMLAGCVQTVDRPPVKLPQYASPYTAPAPQPVVKTADAIDNAAQALASELMAKAGPRIGSRRIAILPMRDTSGQSEAILNTANDAFRVKVFDSGPYYFVADNDMQRALREVLLEDKLRHVDKALDPSVLSRLNKMLSADLVIDSRITDAVTDLGFTAEMIDIATGLLVAISQTTLPKTVLTGSTGASGRPTGAGRTLHYGADWLHTQFESISLDGNRATKAVFVFTNRGKEEVRLVLADPERRAYLVDAAGTPFLYMGADGLDRNGSTTVRPDARQVVSLYFAPPITAKGVLTLRTSWQARGTRTREQTFVIPDLVVKR